MQRVIIAILLLFLLQAEALASVLAGLHVGRSEKGGVVERTTQFSWRVESQQQDVRQVAYCIKAATSVEGLQGGRAQLWDSERVSSGEMQMIPYQGRRLPYASLVYWQVEVWLSNGEHLTSPVMTFSTGLKYAQWKAAWIGPEAAATPADGDTPTSGAAPVTFSRTFAIGSKPLRATMYVSTIGEGICLLNGKPVGGELTGSRQSDVNRTLYYSVFDATRLVVRGQNTLQVTVDPATLPAALDEMGRPVGVKVRAQLVVETATDTVTIATSREWEGASEVRMPRGLLMPQPCEGRSIGDSPVPPLCTFECSDQRLDSIFHSFLPSDSAAAMQPGPQSEAFLSRNAGAAYCWLHSQEDAQREDGYLARADSTVEVLNMLYRRYADHNALLTFYPMLSRWMNYARRTRDVRIPATTYSLMAAMAERIGQQSEAQIFRREADYLAFRADSIALADSLSVPSEDAPSAFGSEAIHSMMSALAGIDQAEGCLAFRQLSMSPTFPDSITHVKASYHSPYGKVQSQWMRQDNTLTWTVDIPACATASLHIPQGWKVAATEQKGMHGFEENDGGTHVELGSGRYTIKATKQQ